MLLLFPGKSRITQIRVCEILYIVNTYLAYADSFTYTIAILFRNLVLELLKNNVIPKRSLFEEQEAHRDIRAKIFPFLYEDGPRAVMGVK